MKGFNNSMDYLAVLELPIALTIVTGFWIAFNYVLKKLKL